MKALLSELLIKHRTRIYSMVRIELWYLMNERVIISLLGDVKEKTREGEWRMLAVNVEYIFEKEHNIALSERQ
jgi:hypothetical protein